MAETVDIDEARDADAGKAGENDPDAGQRDLKETAVPVDDEGRPLIAEDDGNGHQHFRTRPVYKRPAFLIGAIIVLLVVAVFGIRYWLYARSHETDRKSTRLNSSHLVISYAVFCLKTK